MCPAFLQQINALWKMLKISVGSSSSCERSSLGGKLILHQKRVKKRPKLSAAERVFLCNTLIAACYGWKCSQTIVELIEEWSPYVSETAERQALVLCRWSGVKKACFVFNQDDGQGLQNSLLNIVIGIFSFKMSFYSWVDGANPCVSFWQGQNDTLENGTGNYWFY